MEYFLKFEINLKNRNYEKNIDWLININDFVFLFKQ
jgi:hypothetical protein